MYLQTDVYVNENADQWAAQACSNGWTVGTTPAANSVAVFQPGVDSASSVGHVAWVIAVNGSTLTVEAYNWNHPGPPAFIHELPIVSGIQFIYP